MRNCKDRAIFSMQITADRAFWIFEFYRRHGTVLGFANKMPGEESSTEAYVCDVSRQAHAIGMKLFLRHDPDHISERIVSLRDASFFLLQMGTPEFDQLQDAPFHSALIMAFPDGKRMYLAE